MSDDALTWLLAAFGAFAVAASILLVVFWLGVILAVTGLGLLCVWEAKR